MQTSAPLGTFASENFSGEEYRSGVRAALESLKPSQLVRLQTYARWRYRIVGKKAAGRDWEDLLSEAMMSALDGRRSWDHRRVDIYSFLIGAMRSISSRWYAKRSVEFGEADLPSLQLDPDETVPTTLDLFTSTAAGSDPEQVAVADELFRKCKEALRDDDQALQMFDLLSFGMNGKEIVATLNVSFEAYAATAKRLRRRLRKVLVDPAVFRAGAVNKKGAE